MSNTYVNSDSSKEDLEKNNIENNIKELEKASKIGEVDKEEFPDGGKGWLVVLGTFFLTFTTYGMVNAFGEYETYYMHRYPNTKSSVLTLIGSLQPTLIYGMAVPVEICVFYIGVPNTIRLGSFLMIFSFMMLSITHSIWEIFLTQGVLFGIGASAAFLAAMSVPPEYFKRKRALALGITASGSSLGGVIWPIVVQRLLNEVGFGWTNRIVGFIYLPLLFVSCITVIPRIPKHNSAKLVEFQVLKDLKYWGMLLAQAIGVFGLFPPLFFIETYSERLGLPQHVTKYIITILNTASIVGRIAPGYIADKIGRLNTLIPSTFLAGLLQLVLWLPTNNMAGTVSFAVLFGLFSGAFISLLPASIGQLFGIKHNRSRLSLLFTASIPGSLAGAPISSIWLTSNLNSLIGFPRLIIFSGIFMIASSLFMIVVRLSISYKPNAFV